MVVSLRQPVFGRHGRKVVAFLCTWELAALAPGSPIPTVSETVDRHPWFGLLLLLLLGHHWFFELRVELDLAPVGP